MRKHHFIDESIRRTSLTCRNTWQIVHHFPIYPAGTLPLRNGTVFLSANCESSSSSLWKKLIEEAWNPKIHFIPSIFLFWGLVPFVSLLSLPSLLIVNSNFKFGFRLPVCFNFWFFYLSSALYKCASMLLVFSIFVDVWIFFCSP